ncbi:MAG: restriction endonuclease subunit S [Duncaniella sp.]|nr:restriction endonuclease subunit S [Duncaniella sp.]
MATYESYKDSGVKWPGQIPSHWEILPGKAIFDENKTKNTTNRETFVLSLSYGNIIPKRDINEGLVPENYSGYQIVEPGYIIIRCTDLQNDKVSLRTGHVNHHGIISGAYLGLKVKRGVNSRYIHYLLHNWDVSKELYRYGSGLRQSLSWADIKYLLLAKPPLSEQEAIVAYLDKVTGDIDRAIEAQRKMIDALNERKQIIITRAVTRGLNPDAPLRDSGIDWLGQIPAHWEVMKLGSLGITSNGISNDASYFGEGYPFVSYSDVYKNFSLPDVIRGLAKSSERDQKVFSVKRGDVFFTRTSETVDEIGFSSVCLNTIHQAVFAGFLIRFRPKENIIVPEFSKFYFRTSCHRNYFVKEMNLVTRASLSQQLLKGLTVLLPPKSEQNSIADFLNSKITDLDNSIENCERMISLLQERKQIIINEVVTGKTKVI